VLAHLTHSVVPKTARNRSSGINDPHFEQLPLPLSEFDKSSPASGLVAESAFGLPELLAAGRFGTCPT
jgi:hypothetical protein